MATACALVAAAASSATAIQDAPASSAIERALIERTCDRLLATRATDISAHEACIADQLTSLRADFGRDLGRLSPADRRKLDAVCSPLERAESRERYLDCVDGQLAVLRDRLHRGRPAPPDASSPPATTEPLPIAPASTSRQSASIWIWVAALSLAGAGAAAGVVQVRKRRQSVHACSACGATVSDAAGLCAACRHEAAEARRRAAADRVAEAQLDVERREQALEADERARAAEHAKQLALEHEARERQEFEQRTREAADRQEREEAERREREAADDGTGEDADAAFDPYRVLGIRPGADAEAIRAAYEAGKSKYDLEQVSHLSAEVQQHYRTKSAAVERAYLMLTTTT